MAERTYPGVYIEEKSSGPGPITGVSTSNLGLVGFSTKGPTNVPTIVQSYQEFSSTFGSFTALSLAPTEAFAFFQNGGKTLYFVRCVHEADATSASCFLSKTATLGTLVLGDATALAYTFTLPKAPVVAAGTYGTVVASFVITIHNSGSTIITTYTDHGDGTFTTVRTGGSATTDSSIDYTTGEVRLTVNAGTDFENGTYAVGTYYYKTIGFEMRWPGLAGNNYRVVVTGANDYYVAATASYTRYNVTVDEYDSTLLAWTTVESFTNLDFDDPTSNSFVATVMNDLQSGSSLIEVTSYNHEAPTTLAGTLNTNHDVTQTPAYNSVVKAFTYQLGHALAKTTMACQFGFASAGLPITTTVPLVTDHVWSYTPATPVQIHPNTDPAFAQANCGVLLTYTTSVPTATTAGDDGTGLIKVISGGTATGATVGTVNYITGALTLDLGAGFFNGSTAVVLTQYYIGPVVVDDGNGNLSLDNPCGTYSLNSNGTNTVDYTTGAFTLTWKIASNPGAGPTNSNYPAISPITQDQYATYYVPPSASASVTCAGGADGSALDRNDVTGATLVADSKGLYAFDQVDAMMSLVVADFQTSELVGGDVIDYCALRKDKFAILTVPVGLTPQEATNWKRFTLNRNTKYAAVYYPHIQVTDPVTGAAINLPCGGHLAGIYARTDITRNVGKAPAGTTDGALSWLIGLERDLTPSQVGTVYADKINALISWPATGRVVWGASTLDQAGGEWPYIQQTRLFQYIEKSVFNATHLHVFENNSANLWGRIKLQLDTFLLGKFQDGYFAGSTPSEAYFVICDATNNPQNSVDAGITYVDVGIAANRPCVFLVFRFSQKSLV
jgi:phage tail sheath protein FI